LDTGPNFGGRPLVLEGEITGKPLGLMDFRRWGGAGDTRLEAGPDFESLPFGLTGDIRIGL